MKFSSGRFWIAIVYCYLLVFNSFISNKIVIKKLYLFFHLFNYVDTSWRCHIFTFLLHGCELLSNSLTLWIHHSKLLHCAYH